MKRVADYLVQYLYELHVKDIFLVTGVGMMFMGDALRKHKGINSVCLHHEQSAAMAAVSYAKLNENLGAVIVTTGCGGTNTITGLLDAWQDNTPCLFVSGQAKRSETIRNSGLALRQFGMQEADIISIVQNMTKYAVMVNKPQSIAYYLEKAIYLAKSGRPGPVWLDIPLDVQSAMVDETKIEHFDEQEEMSAQPHLQQLSQDAIRDMLSYLNHSKRPVVIAGQGIRLGKSIPSFKRFIEKANIPFVVTKLGIDLLPSNHPLYIGRIGNKGDRAGNFAVQNADLVLVLGSRMSVNSTGHEYHTFAREAKILVVDIDSVEHQKKTKRIDKLFNLNVRTFLAALASNDYHIENETEKWVQKCQYWRGKWPVCLPEYANETEGINTYYFIDRLSKKLKPDSVVVCDAGSAFFVVTQTLQLTYDRQRIITTGGQAEMGYMLPAAIGTSIAKGNQEVIGITGDGSLQMNIQELQSIVYRQLPIKLFIWNNNGYLSTKSAQRNFFDDQYIGANSRTGLSFPELKKISNAYGIQYFFCNRNDRLDETIEEVLSYEGPALCEVICPEDQLVVPSVYQTLHDNGTITSKPLEDMFPFLDRQEFKQEMIITPIEDNY